MIKMHIRKYSAVNRWDYCYISLGDDFLFFSKVLARFEFVRTGGVTTVIKDYTSFTEEEDFQESLVFDKIFDLDYYNIKEIQKQMLDKGLSQHSDFTVQINWITKY